MRVARLLIYEGPELDLHQQLGRSMNDGIRQGSHGVTIQCLTLPSGFLLACEALGQQKIEADYLQAERVPVPMGKDPGPYGVQHAEAPTREPWKQYRRLDGSITDAVPAITWTGDNLRDVQAFMFPDSPLGGVPALHDPAIGIRNQETYGIEFTRPGDWIVKGGTAGHLRYTAAAFAETFEPVPAGDVTIIDTSGARVPGVPRGPKAGDLVCPSCGNGPYSAGTGCAYCLRPGDSREITGA